MKDIVLEATKIATGVKNQWLDDNLRVVFMIEPHLDILDSLGIPYFYADENNEIPLDIEL